MDHVKEAPTYPIQISSEDVRGYNQRFGKIKN